MTVYYITWHNVCAYIEVLTGYRSQDKLHFIIFLVANVFAIQFLYFFELRKNLSYSDSRMYHF